MRQRIAGSGRLRLFIGRTSDGRPVQVARTFQGAKREAQTALAKMVTELQHASVGDRRGVTVAQLFDAWLDHIEPHRKPSTIDRYRRKIKGRIVPALGHIRIDRLTPKRLDDQYRAWREEGLSLGGAVAGGAGFLPAAVGPTNLEQSLLDGWLGPGLQAFGLADDLSGAVGDVAGLSDSWIPGLRAWTTSWRAPTALADRVG